MWVLVSESYITSWSFKKESDSTYNRCLLSGGYKCRPLVEKLPEPQFGVHLQEVHLWRCPQAKVQLCLDNSNINSIV